MATFITDECIACGACEPECPNGAITEGEQLYIIHPGRCTECVGFHVEEMCASVCPVDSCLPVPDREEEEDVLIARARKLHPSVDFGTDFKSRFR